jgi:hypothetical protein
LRMVRFKLCVNLHSVILRNHGVGYI